MLRITGWTPIGDFIRTSPAPGIHSTSIIRAYLHLVMDSLRYWATEMHVDGFRFDLAPTLARENGEYSQGSAFFDAIGQDPVMAGLKLIAEPWDIGPVRLSARQFSARMGRMERPISRYVAPVLEG